MQRVDLLSKLRSNINGGLALVKTDVLPDSVLNYILGDVVYPRVNEDHEFRVEVLGLFGMVCTQF